MEKRFGVLRAIAAVYQILAVLALVGTVLTILSDTPYAKWLIVVVGVATAISFFATGEGILVFLGIEENTRRQADAMERWTSGQAPPAP